jgi:hypothetical protein
MARKARTAAAYGLTPEHLASATVRSLSLRAPGPAGAPGEWPTVLGLDVSSRASGWALMRGPDNLLHFGVIKAASHVPTRRIDRIVDGVAALAAEHRPDVVCMEWSTGQTASWLAKAGRKPTGLTTLGAAQGATRERLKAMGLDVRTVSEKWTGARRKEARALVVRLAFPAFRAWAEAGNDEGNDAADAVGLCSFHYHHPEG